MKNIEINVPRWMQVVAVLLISVVPSLYAAFFGFFISSYKPDFFDVIHGWFLMAMAALNVTGLIFFLMRDLNKRKIGKWLVIISLAAIFIDYALYEVVFASGSYTPAPTE